MTLPETKPQPPLAERRDHTVFHLETSWRDELAWLKDREDPAVLQHLEAENAHTEALTEHLAPLRKALYDEILSRIEEDDAEVPYRKGPWLYYGRTEKGKAYRIHCRRPAHGGDEQVLLDENELAEGRAFFHLGALAISPDHRWLAWAEDHDGSEKYVIRQKDLSTGEILAQEMAGAKPVLAWANDGRHLFYATPDEVDRPYRLWRHDRSAPDADALVFEEPDARFYLDVGRSRDDRWLVLGLHSKLTSEVWLLDADAPEAPPRVVRPRVHGVLYQVEPHDDHLFLLDNVGAPNFRLLALPADDLDAEPEVVLAHDPEVYLTGIDAFAEHLVVWQRRDGLSGVRILDLAGGAHEITFDEVAWAVSADVNAEFETTTLRFRYESLLTPPSIVAYDMVERTRTVLKRDPTPNYDPSRYVMKRTWAKSHDGTLVPVTLAMLAGTDPDGTHPALIAGYGAYGVDTEPWFRRTWFSLLDRGVVCALAHIRGGSEMGRLWYEHGKLERKTNSFEDFVACADHLEAAGWAAPNRIGCWGGSAGGLLVGAATNLRPERFAAVLALVPFVDAVNTMLDETLPLTITEYEEWGDPRQPEPFEIMRSYSPYDNVGPNPYPAILATAGLNDPRVGYWEPAKWVQRLREHTTSDQPVLLKVNLGAGHGGASGRYGRIEEAAFEYAFLLDRLGATEPKA